jgi:hypothetical protein
MPILKRNPWSFWRIEDLDIRLLFRNQKTKSNAIHNYSHRELRDESQDWVQIRFFECIVGSVKEKN